MKYDARATIRDRIDDLYRSESRRVFASLVRLLNDFDLADDAMHEAYAAAVEIWQQEGVPANPRVWLISTGKFKAIDSLRRQGRLKVLQPEIASRLEQVADENAARAATEIEDDRLRLIFTCCHPAIDPKLQVTLTLREVCGLTTEQIAHAFLTSKARSRGGPGNYRPHPQEGGTRQVSVRPLGTWRAAPTGGQNGRRSDSVSAGAGACPTGTGEAVSGGTNQ
jgi:RNA polymerase sigma factor (sigma-70 family)